MKRRILKIMRNTALNGDDEPVGRAMKPHLPLKNPQLNPVYLTDASVSIDF